ncbi:hypothetical protein M0804_000171 [Polistes exclamans]|nr:hypothetical protein M0804_000171 [Polistes exclamans]
MPKLQRTNWLKHEKTENVVMTRNRNVDDNDDDEDDNDDNDDDEDDVDDDGRSFSLEADEFHTKPVSSLTILRVSVTFDDATTLRRRDVDLSL